MSRRSFLLGHLTGLALGVVLMLASNSWITPPKSAIRPSIIPASGSGSSPKQYQIVPPQTKTPDGSVIPHNDRAINPEWHSFEFNGQKVYIIPLAQNSSSVPIR